jgi:hypothetical protein
MQSLGKQLRDDGMDAILATQQGWKASVVTLVKRYLRGKEVTGEEIRLFVRPQVGNPGHPNAWGAVIYSMVSEGLLVDTGRVHHCAIPSSHARRLPVWYVTYVP